MPKGFHHRPLRPVRRRHGRHGPARGQTVEAFAHEIDARCRGASADGHCGARAAGLAARSTRSYQRANLYSQDVQSRAAAELGIGPNQLPELHRPSEVVRGAQADFGLMEDVRSGD